VRSAAFKAVPLLGFERGSTGEDEP